MSDDTRSQIAKELSKLKENITRVIKERERLPQPLFWSLFNTQLSSLRHKKRQIRLIDEVFNDSSE